MEIEIRGIPKPQARPRVFMRGKAVISWSPKSEWIQSVLEILKMNRPPEPIEGFLAVTIIFYMPRPKSCKKGQIFMNKRPDWDNLARAVTDAAQQANWIKDDGQIVSATILKKYENGSGPGCWLKIESHDLG